VKVNADKLTRIIAVAAAVAVTAVAAMISYKHAVEVVTRHGASGLTGHLYPVVIDGPLVVASMVVVDSARRREPAGALAWVMLAAGIVATITVNLISGIAYGPVGAIIAAWPAAAFVGTYELLMVLVRRSAGRSPDSDQATAELATAPVVPIRTETAQAPEATSEHRRPTTRDIEDLLAQARLLDTEHRVANDGKPISRENLRRALKTSTDRADRVLKIIRAEAREAVKPAQDEPSGASLDHLSPAA
jgi:Protein of unknown function (DUF2637)